MPDHHYPGDVVKLNLGAGDFKQNNRRFQNANREQPRSARKSERMALKCFGL